MDATCGAMKPARPKILLLEDDAGVRRSLQLLLQAKGYDVRSHARGTTLLADEESRGAACLVADYRVDDIDGIAVLSRLRADGWQEPAVLITAFPSGDIRKAAEAVGYAAILDKPLRQNALVDLLAQLLVQPTESSP